MSRDLTTQKSLTPDEVNLQLQLLHDLLEQQISTGRFTGEISWLVNITLGQELPKPNSRQVLLRQAGALAEDESLPDLLVSIFAKRGRPEIEEPDGS